MKPSVHSKLKKRVAIVGAGLCGSFVAALLRNHFQVTVIEQGKKKRPLYDEVTCEKGDVNSSINRAAGLGGTTNYWHDALIELDDSDLRHAGISPAAMGIYYAKAWSLFLSPDVKHDCDQIRQSNSAAAGKVGFCSIGHMVVPYVRANAWTLANERYPGDPIKIVYGVVERLVPQSDSRGSYLMVEGDGGPIQIAADYFIFCAGGLSTPILLSKSLGKEGGFCGGYHDHPMAYVGKVKLQPNSFMKRISSSRTDTCDIRSGFVFETAEMKAVFYLRPAVNLDLKSITGPSRHVLSDLRNDPFSPVKIWKLLTNLDALKEAILFKSRTGFQGDYYSVLMLGEQLPAPSRGISLQSGGQPMLNWNVMPDEHSAYQKSFMQFLKTFSGEFVDTNLVAPDNWDYRTAAHHSGAASPFLGKSEDLELSFFAVNGLANSYVCDASMLRAGGISNTGLTLVGLSHRLAERLQEMA